MKKEQKLEIKKNNQLLREKFKKSAISNMPFEKDTQNALSIIKVLDINSQTGWGPLSSVEELISFSEEVLSQYIRPHYGIKTIEIVNDIKNILALHGLKLSGSEFSPFDVDVKFLVKETQNELIKKIIKFLKLKTLGDVVILDKSRVINAFDGTYSDVAELKDDLSKFGMKLNSPIVALNEKYILSRDLKLLVERNRKPLSASNSIKIGRVSAQNINTTNQSVDIIQLSNDLALTKPQTHAQALQVIQQYLDTPIENSDLPQKAIIKVSRTHPELFTIRDIIEFPSRTELAMSVLGQSVYNEVKDILLNHGITLSGKKTLFTFKNSTTVLSKTLTSENAKPRQETKRSFVYTDQEYKNMPKEKYLDLLIPEADIPLDIATDITEHIPHIQTIRDLLDNQNKYAIRHRIGRYAVEKIRDVLEKHDIKFTRKYVPLPKISELDSSVKHIFGKSYLQLEINNSDLPQVIKDKIAINGKDVKYIADLVNMGTKRAQDIVTHLGYIRYMKELFDTHGVAFKDHRYTTGPTKYKDNVEGIERNKYKYGNTYLMVLIKNSDLPQTIIDTITENSDFQTIYDLTKAGKSGVLKIFKNNSAVIKRINDIFNKHDVKFSKLSVGKKINSENKSSLAEQKKLQEQAKQVALATVKGEDYLNLEIANSDLPTLAIKKLISKEGMVTIRDIVELGLTPMQKLVQNFKYQKIIKSTLASHGVTFEDRRKSKRGLPYGNAMVELKNKHEELEQARQQASNQTTTNPATKNTQTAAENSATTTFNNSELVKLSDSLLAGNIEALKILPEEYFIEGSDIFEDIKSLVREYFFVLCEKFDETPDPFEKNVIYSKYLRELKEFENVVNVKRIALTQNLQNKNFSLNESSAITGGMKKHAAKIIAKYHHKNTNMLRNIKPHHFGTKVYQTELDVDYPTFE